MTLQENLITYRYELSGFVASAASSSLKFSEMFEKGIQVAVFAFITGIVGAFAAHLYKIIVNKLSKKK